MTYKTVSVAEIADTYFTLHLTYVGGVVEKGRDGQLELSSLTTEAGYFRWLDQEGKITASTTRDIDYASRMTEAEAIALKSRRAGWAKRNCVDIEIIKMVPYVPYEKTAHRSSISANSSCTVRLKMQPIAASVQVAHAAIPQKAKLRNTDQMRRDFLQKLGLDEAIIGTKACNQQVKKWAHERGLNPNLNTRNGWELVTDWVEVK